MGFPDVKRAVIALLAQPRGQVVWQSASSTDGWRRGISRGGGQDADPSTIRFAQQRGIQGHEIHAVTFADQEGKRYRFLVGVAHDADGWEVSGLAGGGECDPPRGQPWAAGQGTNWRSSAASCGSR